MNEVTVGSVVTLNSGGPRMTVMAVENGQLQCIWFPYLDNGFAREPAEQWFPLSCVFQTDPALGRDAGARA